MYVYLLTAQIYWCKTTRKPHITLHIPQQYRGIFQK